MNCLTTHHVAFEKDVCLSISVCSEAIYRLFASVPSHLLVGQGSLSAHSLSRTVRGLPQFHELSNIGSVVC